MASDLATIQNQLPADIRAMLAQQIASDVGRIGSISDGKDAIRITQDKKFILPTGVTVDELTCVIVDFVYRNEYYGKAFNPKAITPPVCYAISPVQSDLAPLPSAPQKQCETVCAECQWDKFGSSPTGDGKACKNVVFLAVLPTDADADTPLWVLKTSPTAITTFNKYVAKLASSAQIPVTAAVTRISFNPSKTYATLAFDVEDVNKNFGVTNARRDEARMRLSQEPKPAV